MTPYRRRGLQVATALFLLGLRPIFATTIGTGQTVNDFSLVGQNINFDSTLTYISTGTDPNYDTGAGLVNLTGSFTESLGTGANQVQWTGSGGFTTGNPQATLYDVNIGGLATPQTLTWGQGGFVPNGSALVLNGAIFENNINLGTDTSATRQIDVGTATIDGQITGSGNLLLQGYGQAIVHSTVMEAYQTPTGFLPALINVSGSITLNNVDLAFGLTTASSYNLTNGSALQSFVQGSPDVTLSGRSIWLIFPGTGTFVSQSVGSLTSTDPSSLIRLGGIIAGEQTSASLTVNSGYFAGEILDNVYPASPGKGGSLIKEGPGIFTLANDNSGDSTSEAIGYSQGTVVEQGTLLIANTTGSATGTGPVTVMMGASLGGQGIIAPTGSSDVVVEPGGALDLTAYDPAHPPTVSAGTFQVHLDPANIVNFQPGSGLGFVLASGRKSSTLAFTGLSANVKQVFFNNTKVNFRVLAGANPGIYTLVTFDQSGAYSGTLASRTGWKFIYQPQAILVQVTSAAAVGAGAAN